MAERRPFPPSPRRLALARQAGLTAASSFLVGALACGAAIVATIMVARGVATRLGAWIAAASSGSESLSVADIPGAILDLAAPLLLAAATIAVIAHVVQTRAFWLPRRRVPGAPVLDNGAGPRTTRGAFELTAAAVIGLVAFGWLWTTAPRLATLVALDPSSAPISSATPATPATPAISPAASPAPFAPSRTAPLAPSGTAPLAPSGTAPLAPSGTAPLAPSGTAPLVPSGTAPLAPSGTAPLAPSGTAPVAASSSAPSHDQLMVASSSTSLAPSSLASSVGAAIASLVITLVIAWLVLAVIDALLRRAQLQRALAMTPTEKREDDRVAAADPRWKAHRAALAKGPAVADAVARAAVVLLGDDTAVAIAWDPTRQPVPLRTATGRTARATQLLALARRHRIAVHRDAALAAALVDGDGPVPDTHWRRLADIIAAVGSRRAA